MPDANQPILFFDGVCNLCDSFVQFVIKHDKRKQFMFASLQSQAGQEAMQHIKKDDGTVPESVVLYHNNRYYTKSDVILRGAKILGGGWQLVLAGYILPPVVRNAIYDWVARNRYRWFGKKDACMIPTPELRSRFLND